MTKLASIDSPHRIALLRAPAKPGLAIDSPHRIALLRAPAKPGLAILALLGVAACHSGEATAPPAPPERDPGGFHAEPPIDVASSVPAAELAFAAEGGVFRGRYRTHEVAVVDGIIDITPSHVDERSGARTVGGTMGIQTTTISIGDRVLDIGAGVPRVAAPNVVELPRGGGVVGGGDQEITERITNREDGIEQAWRFAAPLLVPGALSVEVAVSGHELVAATASGLHFQSARGLGFRYSHAIWRDAAGNAWDIEARFEDAAIRMTVPEEVLAASVYPAILDPVVSGELFIDNPVNGTTGAASYAQDLASDGTRYLAVWTDQRNGNDDIYGTRINADGTVADALGIRIHVAAGVQRNPTVAFVGTGYVVAWEHVAAAGNTNISAAFVSGDTGAVTQLGTVAGTGANETLPALGASGAEALLVWQSGEDMSGARFAAGAFGAALSVAAGANVEKDPHVSGSPAGGYLVTFTEALGTNDNVRGQRVTAAGALDGAAFDIAAGTAAETQPAAAFDGTNHVVAYTVVRPGTSNDVAVVRVSPMGTLVDAVPVFISAAGGAQIAPDIVCNGPACFLAWEDTRAYATTLRDVFGAAITAEPAVAVVANDISISAAIRQQTAPSLASAGGQYAAAWSDTRELDSTSVRAARIDAAGVVLDASALTIVTGVSSFQAPAIAQTTGFTDYIWAASQVPDVNLVHVRFDGGGVQLDASPRVISSAPGAQLNPAGAGIGANALAVWQDSRGADRDIYAARVNMATGETLDPSGILVASAPNDQAVPKVASSADGTAALIVWQDRRTGAFDIHGAVVSSTGAVTAAAFPICTAAGDQTRPNVAYDAVNNVYLVVWTDPNGTAFDIRGARVSPAGVVLDADCGVLISGAAGSQFSADVTFGGGQFFVAWEDRRNDANLGDIYGARVTASGGALSVLDPAGIAVAQVAGSQQAEVAVAFAGYGAGSFVAVWTDNRAAAQASNDIRGAQISATGAIASQFVVAGTTESERTPDLSSGTSAAKPLTVAYLKTSSVLQSVRVQVRRITITSTNGQACTQDSQCESGYCRDYKCCDSDCGGGGANGNTGDCQACSTAHHGQADGTCSVILNTNYVCRLYADSFCDLSERCDGASTACPPDLGRRQGQVCNGTTGAVCPANDATGAPHVCPP